MIALAFHQTTLLLCALRQVFPVLSLMAGQAGQLGLLVQMAHVGLGDLNPRQEFLLNLGTGGASFLA